MTNSNLNHAFESLRRTAELLTKTLRPHIEQLTTGLSEMMKPFAKLVRQTLEEHELNIKTGWWYPNYIVDDLPTDTVHEAFKDKPCGNDNTTNTLY